MNEDTQRKTFGLSAKMRRSANEIRRPPTPEPRCAGSTAIVWMYPLKGPVIAMMMKPTGRPPAAATCTSRDGSRRIARAER